MWLYVSIEDIRYYSFILVLLPNLTITLKMYAINQVFNYCNVSIVMQQQPHYNDKYIIENDELPASRTKESTGNEIVSQNEYIYLDEPIDYYRIDFTKVKSLSDISWEYFRIRPLIDIPTWLAYKINHFAMMCSVKLDKCKTCNSNAYYANPGEMTTSACRYHKSNSMTFCSDRSIKCLICNERQREYGMLFHRKATLCCKCTLLMRDFIHISNRKCRMISCETTSIFGYPGENSQFFCKSHRLPNMTDTKNKRCLYEGCTNQPSYNYPENKVSLYCKSHRLEGMINVVSKRCINPNCSTIPSYNYPGNKVSLYCKLHCLDGMIDIRSKRCLESGCNTIPTYSYHGSKLPLYCASHRLEGMVDIKHVKCKIDGCNIRPSYNYSGSELPLYCSSHRLEDMVDVIHETCLEPNCNIQPCYNYKGEKNGLYCSSHRLVGMIDIKSKRCGYINCEIRPSYNYPGTSIGLYCVSHHLPNMINVVNKKCDAINCSLIASHNYIGTKHSLCKEHSINGMVYSPYRICRFEDCDNPCLTGYQTPRLKLMHCLQHREPDEIDFTQNKCNTCSCTHTILDEDGDCLDCSKLGTRVELRVRTFFLQNNIQYKSHDTPLPSCGYRPDFLFEFESSCLVAEVDERQHRGYDKLDEEIRMLAIAEELRKPTIFLRFNPDEYSSPYQSEFNERLQTLKWYIEKCYTYISTNMCERIYLFYDNWDPNDVKPIPVYHR